MRIAICDDNAESLRQICGLLDIYGQDHPLTYTAFDSPADLLETLQEDCFDLFVLDVMMPKINGLDAAREIRQSDTQVPILFLTSSPEFALESYQVRAAGYLLKPVSADRLFPLLQEFSLREEQLGDGLTIKTKAVMRRIPFGQIEYVEVQNRTVLLYLSDNSVQKISASLSGLEDQLLARPEFVKTHRAFLANMQWMRSLTSSGFVTASGHTIPVARNAYPQIREAYMNYLFRGGKEI